MDAIAVKEPLLHVLGARFLLAWRALHCRGRLSHPPTSVLSVGSSEIVKRKYLSRNPCSESLFVLATSRAFACRQCQAAR
jgi:hypothetical protein